MSSKKLASLLIKIGVNGVAVEKAFRDITKSAEKVGKTLKKTGDKMSLYLTAPILAAGAASAKAADTQLKAEAKLLNALKGRADIQKRLMAQASEIQSRSLYGDEAIIEQQSFLAALGLTEEQISATMEAAVQLSAALGIDLGSAVKNLSKTYGGLTGELGESIPALRDLTAEELKAGGAIAYVNENYKGFAETAARTGTGPMQQLKNSLGDLAEQLGVILMPVIQKITEWLSHLVAWLQQLSPGVQKLIVVVAALAAAFGPLISSVGRLIVMFPKLSAAIWALKGPLGVITAALVGAISLYSTLIDKARQADKQRAGALNKEMYETYSMMKDSSITAELNRMQKEYDELSVKFANMSRGVMWNMTRSRLLDLDAKMSAARQVLAERSQSATSSDVGSSITTEIDSFNTGVVQATGLIGKLEARLSELEKAKVWAKTSDEIRQINQDIQGVSDELERLRSLTYGEEVGSAEGVTIRSSVPGFGVSSAIASPLASILPDSQISEWREKMLQKAEAMKSVITEINDIIRSAVAGLATSIGEMLGDLWTGDTFDPVQMLLELLGNSLKQIGAALVKYATMFIALKAALKNIMQNPWVALALGIGAIAGGTALINYANRREYVPKLAKGGLAYGPTLAVVGDNPNAASDPEVIAPLSKLRSMGAANRLELVGEVEWKISGSSLRAVLGKENFRLSRLG